MPSILLTKHPSLTGFKYSSVQDYFKKFVDSATEFNVATGFISNEAIATLQQIVAFKSGKMKLNLFIGMHYVSGFTRIQYKAIKELNDFLNDAKCGNIYLSPHALFHGKMYSFFHDNDCLGGFIGSSNLGSFVGEDPNYVETDALFVGEEGVFVNQGISNVIQCLGKNFVDLPPLMEFIEPDSKLLQSYHYVTEVNEKELKTIKNSRTDRGTYIVLKSEPFSNLNTYFGAGKVKDRYSPRGWYEVELIIGKRDPAMEQIPTEYPITVVTNDGYKFQCKRQGTNFKNFRSSNDLKILGRWIKGQMENEGALEIGKPVTEGVLQEFGKGRIFLEETTVLDDAGHNIWYISLR
ncbi:MAG: NgoFVII family restriction endonuclease [Bacteroidales bacterium]|nr:NgoFVII family restriction endonuclease [Bacteroidales bacterium]